MQPRLVLALLLTSLSLPAQQKPVARPASSTYRIEGKVVDAESGGALSRTRVAIAPVTARNLPQSTISAADGSFAFLDVPPGKYQLLAERSGFPQQAYDQ